MKNMINFIAAFICLFACLPVLGKTIHVPKEAPTIQDGIDLAVYGDTVLVAQGTYKGTGNKLIDYNGKAITVVSQDGPQNTIIDCEYSNRAFIFRNGEGRSAVLQGFKLTGGAAHWGGAIQFTDYSSPTISNCIIQKNSAHSGGGIYCEDSSPAFINCTISEDSASTRGGGILCINSSPSFQGCKINKNTSKDKGGGFYLEKDHSVIESCEISGNKAALHGGGMFLTNANSVVKNCSVTENSTGGKGGGIQGDEASFVLENSTISGNIALENGGGINIGVSSKPILTNSVITNNSAGEYGGGIYTWGSTPEIKHCTIVSNSASISGGGLGCEQSNPQVINSILWNDTPDEIYETMAAPEITYSCVQGGYSGQGNIDSDPMFTGAGNYHLKGSSPCIDSGIDAGVYTDIDGDRRPQIRRFDIGSDEYIATGPWITIFPENFSKIGKKGTPAVKDSLRIMSNGKTSLTYLVKPGFHSWLTLSGDVEGTLEPGASEYIYIRLSPSKLDPGKYHDFIKIQSNDPLKPEITVYLEFIVYSSHIFLVPEHYPSIQEGIDATIDGDTVYVADGTYTGLMNTNIDFGGKAIKVMSRNGRDVTMIDCNKTGRGIYFHSGEGSDSRLQGFTIREGRENFGGGIYIEGFTAPCSPQIINCQIVNNAASIDGGGIYCTYSSPSFIDCVMMLNSAQKHGGGADFLYSNPSFTRCIFKNNSAGKHGGAISCRYTSSAVLINSILAENNCVEAGGAVSCYVSSPLFINCTITKNSAFKGGALYCDDLSHPELKNSILWADTPEEIYFVTSHPTISYSDVQGGWQGTGNIDSDPAFAVEPEFHLMQVSPCIDAGTASDAPVNDIDMEARPRDDPLHPNTYSAFDMGADEFYPGTQVNDPGKETPTSENVLLNQNYPNPFNPFTTVSYYLPARTKCTLTIYDLSGTLVCRLIDRVEDQGYHQIIWNGTNESGSIVASGVYYYRIEALNFTEYRKMLILK